MQVLECIPAHVAKAVTAALRVPTIGIGAGPDCSGQVLWRHSPVSEADFARIVYTTISESCWYSPGRLAFSTQCNCFITVLGLSVHCLSRKQMNVCIKANFVLGLMYFVNRLSVIVHINDADCLILFKTCITSHSVTLLSFAGSSVPRSAGDDAAPSL